MTIRTATELDLQTIMKLGEALQDESRDFEPLLIFDMASSLQHYSEELTNKDARIMVAIVNDEIVGYQYAFVEVLDYLSENNRQCTLEAIYVLPNYRGQGIAKSLIADMEHWAIVDMGVDRIRANIYAGNTVSETIHEKDGFSAYNIEYIKRISSDV